MPMVVPNHAQYVDGHSASGKEEQAQGRSIDEADDECQNVAPPMQKSVGEPAATNGTENTQQGIHRNNLRRFYQGESFHLLQE